MSIKINLDEVRYVTETTITIRGPRRRTTVPKEIVDIFELKDGDRFIWILFNDNRLTLAPRKVVEQKGSS
jgi:bifunctional DNA-binding transcriptional regulator/antitoxin component of YhaV-PrlF toxin-antitoxin module